MFEIETDINKRWENGIEHHPESIKTIKALSELDFYLGNDSLGVKTGGDGDNGEYMMYLLDIYFEAKDKGIDLDTIIKEIKPAFLEKVNKKNPSMI